MKNQTLLHTLLVGIAIVLCASVITPAQAQDGGMLARINGLRAGQGLPPYRVNGALAAAAQSQAQWMAQTGTLSHNRPDGSTVRTRTAAAGYASSWVGENIYGGANANPDSAWGFWVNSAVHYAGLISANYQEIGIGSASSGWGSTYVLVFGNPGGVVPAVTSGDGGSRSNAPRRPPAFIVGYDDLGNILHLVQEQDTLGDIALNYGYSWDDIPMMMALNALDNPRLLVVGTIFKVPPRSGTFTPTPDDRTPTPNHTPTLPPPTITPYVPPTRDASSDASPPLVVATADDLPEFLLPIATPAVIIPTPMPTANPTATEESVAIAALPTNTPLDAASPTETTGSGAPTASTWLLLALGLQAAVIVGAGIEFIRRMLRR